MPQRSARIVFLVPSIMALPPSESDAFQVVPARLHIGERAAGVPRIALLLHRDETAIAPFGEKGADRRIGDDTAADRAHDSSSAGLEKADALAHHAVENGTVDVLEMDVVDPVPVAPQRVERVHSGVIAVAGVDAEARHVGGNVGGKPVDLVPELDIAARVWVDDGAHAELVARR